MRQNITKALTKNIGLKILAVIFAFLLWLFVVNVDDPKQTRTFTAVVSVTNQEVLRHEGKLYEIRDGVNTVSFRVTAKRSIIEKLSSSDFSAVADMAYLEDESRIPVTISAKNYSGQLQISSKQNYLYVVIMDESSEKLVVNAKTSGELTSGLAIDSVSCSPNVITVTGPENIVSSIATCEATIDITGVTADITESVIPVFYDENGFEVDTSKLSLSTPTIDVTVDFVSLKTVDIVVKTSGSLSNGKVLGSITTDPSSVLIKGQPSELNDVTAIVIPESVINLSEINSSMTATVDITPYLPNGVSLVDYVNSTVTIYVNMENEEAKAIDVPAKNIKFVNIPDGAVVGLTNDHITVNVFGVHDVVSDFDGSGLLGHIDCSSVTSDGEMNLVLVFEPYDGITVQSTNVSVTVSGLSKTEDDTETDDSKKENSDTKKD